MSKKFMKVAVALALISLLVLPAIASAQVRQLTVEGFEESGLATAELTVTVARIINAALGLLGLVAVVIILIGGFKWMTAMGNEENVKKAKTLIVQGVIGLVIIICSYAIASFIFSALNEATS